MKKKENAPKFYLNLSARVLGINDLFSVLSTAKYLLVFVLAMCSLTAFANHIVGGDMYYDCLGNNQYRIYLKVYRDCAATGTNVADFDDEAYIGVFNASGATVIIDSVAFNNNRTNIPPMTSNPCYQAPANVCVEEGLYTYDITLPPIAGGYDIVYTRCCRNASILNILNPDQVGATYSVHIDPQLISCDNSPRFNAFPPIVICAGIPLVFDHSATDPDGDSLSYSFCTPNIGGDPNDPKPIPTNGPFGNVQWQTPYGLNNLLGGTPAMTIDPVTGIINANPTTQGRFVVGVCCNEYRNGVLIGTIRRDFQFNVTLCLTNVTAVVPIEDTVGAAATQTTGVFQIGCDSINVHFINHSVNATTYHWDFGVQGVTNDTSNLFQPVFAYPDTGKYIVTLIANPGYFCADTTKVYVWVFPGFKAGFDVTPDCENHPLLFTDQSVTQYGTVSNWNWTFGDSGTSTIQSPQHLYGDGGTYNVKLVATTSKGCKDTITKQVVVNPVPKGQINNSPPCLDQAVAISTNATIKSGSIANYQWDFGNGASGNGNPDSVVYTALGTNTITLVMTSDLGCKDTVTLPITVVAPPIVQTRSDTSICLNDPITLTATGAVTYTWTPSTGLSTTSTASTIATPADTTTYIVTGADAVGCLNTDTVTIDILPLPNTDAGKDTFVCYGSSYQLQGSGGVIYAWTPNRYMNDTTLANPTITPDSATTYVLTATNIYTCKSSDSVNIDVQYPIVTGLTGDHVICRYDTVQLVATGGKYYLWTPSDGLSSDVIANPFASPADTTNYQVKIYNDCFADSVSWLLAVNQLPTVTAAGTDTIYRDETTSVSVTGSAINYVWQPAGVDSDSTSTPLLVSPFNTTTYLVTGTDENGCKNKDSVTIYVNVKNLLLVPDAFTPNHDGTNDLLRIVRHLNIQELYEFSIYNRWGEKVFTTNNIKAGWDGTYKGSDQGVGVYVYVIRALNRDGKEITQRGNITLIR